MSTIRVVHYLNQFFVGLGAEAHAGTGPGKKAGAVGPGIALQQALGERAQVVATVYCGDNYANERANAIDAILELVSEERPDILIAGPAFASGRYGLVCGALCVRAQDALGIVAVTGMHPDNPGTDLYRSKVHIARTRESAAGMGEAVKAMARLALKLYATRAAGDTPRGGVHFHGTAGPLCRGADRGPACGGHAGQEGQRPGVYHRVARAQLQPGAAGAAAAGPSPRQASTGNHRAAWCPGATRTGWSRPTPASG